MGLDIFDAFQPLELFWEANSRVCFLRLAECVRLPSKLYGLSVPTVVHNTWKFRGEISLGSQVTVNGSPNVIDATYETSLLLYYVQNIDGLHTLNG